MRGPWRGQSLVGLCLLMLILSGCQSTPKNQKFTDHAVSAQSAPAAMAVVEDPLVMAAVKELQVACLRSSQLKSRVESTEICDCIVRNHEQRLPAAELQSLVKKYRAGKKGFKPRTPEEANLFDYDYGVATECVKNPSYLVPEEP
jgi:hypothetical protein